jgi:hypothetical protein
MSEHLLSPKNRNTDKFGFDHTDQTINDDIDDKPNDDNNGELALLVRQRR